MHTYAYTHAKTRVRTCSFNMPERMSVNAPLGTFKFEAEFFKLKSQWPGYRGPHAIQYTCLFACVDRCIIPYATL